MDLSRFEGVNVLEPEGREIDLGNSMHGCATVLVFVRHFG